MAEDRNPYAAPKAIVRDVEEPDLGDFIPAGRSVGAGRGWAWIVEGWRYFMQSPGTWIGLVLIFGVIFVVLGMIPLVGFVINLMFPVFIAGVMLGCKALEDGDGLQVGHLFAGFNMNAGQLTLIGLLYLLCVIAVAVVAFLIAGGPSMLGLLQGDVMPGGPGFLSMAVFVLVMFALLVPVIMLIWFAPALCGLNRLSATQSMGNSFKGCLKNILPFLVYGLVFLLASVLGFALLGFFIAGGVSGYVQGSGGIGMLIVAGLIYLVTVLIVVPVVWGSMYAAYRDIYYEGAGG